MRTNIMLCFLSDVKLARDTGAISGVDYQNIGEKKECHTTNESAVRYLLSGAHEPADQLSRLFLVRTNKVAGAIQGYNATHDWEQTHYDYFLHRISDIVPHAEQIAEAIDFDENEPIEENMNVLIDVSSHVRRYAKDVRKDRPDTEIILHVDVTGGPRNASMILVALMRLLQYENIRIGKVLYSDYNKKRVEEVNPLYSFFDLVAGAEEFVRHGEVTVMNRFFEQREKSQALRALLASMRKFAEELKLCHYGDLRDAIVELQRSITAFSSAATGNATAEAKQSDELMRQMLGRIEEDYAKILKEELDDIALIHWCIAHDLLQQAMTLVTERVPEALVDSGFLSLSSEEVQALFECKLEEDSMHRNRGVFLVTEFKYKNMKNFQKAKNEWREKRQRFFKEFRQEVTEDKINEFVDGRLSDRFEVRLKDAETLRAFLLWLNRMRSPEKCSLQHTEHGRMYLEQIKPIYIDATKGDWDALLANTDNFVVAKLIRILGSQDSKCPFLDIEWKPGACRLYEAGIEPRDKNLAEDILDKYFVIKDERNHTNHARAEKGRMAVDSLKNIMEQILKDTEIACRMAKEQA